jgi:hypothetical protein
LLLVGLAAVLRYFFFQPSEPEVRIIALGGGAVIPDDALAIRSYFEGGTSASVSGMNVSPPVSSRTVLIDDDPTAVLLDDLDVVRVASGRTVILNDISDVSATATSNTVVIAIRVVAEDDQSIERLEVHIDGDSTQMIGGAIPARPPVTHFTQDICLIINPVRSSAYVSGTSHDLTGSQPITVIAQNSDGSRGGSEGIALEVAYQPANNQAYMAVTSVVPCSAGLFPPFAITTVTPDQCHDDAAFVADVTVPDCTVFEPEATFDKTWRLRNTGTCTWDVRYQLTYVDGAKLGAPGAVNVPHAVAPGDTVDITVPMVAPHQCGKYLSFWRMCNPDCVKWFGATFDVIIEVQKAHQSAEDLPAITRFEVEPNVISHGQQATLHWEYTNGTSARLDPGGQEVGPSGSQVVSPEHTITYRLVVINATGSVQRTTKLRVHPEPGHEPDPGPSPPPPSPANLATTGVRSDGFDFSWVDTSVDEQGFRLYDADTRQAIATFPANVTSGGISGLNCGRTYGFYLVSFNERGESLPSNTLRASTNACGG